MNARPQIDPGKKTRTHVDTIGFTRKEAEKWLNPPFQRELKITAKIKELAEEIRQTAVIPGVLTFGKLKGETYLLDGQHRRAAFLLTELDLGYADVRIHSFDTIAEMGEEFVNLNTQLVRLKPDDILRDMEGTCAPLHFVKTKCGFVGYDMIRRSEKAPVLSMSQLLRSWMTSRSECPSPPGPAMHIAQTLTQEEAALVVKAANLLFEAWGRTEDTKRLWGGLNLVVVFWLYRRLCLGGVYAPSTKRFVQLTEMEFRKCVMALGANEKYVDWLHGRVLNERNRSPAYTRVKDIFAKRIMEDRKLTSKPLLPQPAWASRHGHGL